VSVMAVKITHSFPPITEAELQQFEDELGILLPREYRDFLLAHNGGKPKPDTFNVDMDGFKNTNRVICFLGIAPVTDHAAFAWYLKGYKGRIPHSLLPIAYPLNIDLICLSVHAKDYGRVYYWDHNWEVTETEPDYSNVHLVAENFTQFLELLYDHETD
jgi:hypothetical protein